MVARCCNGIHEWRVGLALESLFNELKVGGKAPIEPFNRKMRYAPLNGEIISSPFAAKVIIEK